MSSYLNFIPANSASSSSYDAERQVKAGNAHLLSCVLDVELPVFRDNPISEETFRDLGRGGSFTVSSGDLKIDMRKNDVFFTGKYYDDVNKDGYGDEKPLDFKKGQTVAIKSLNIDSLDYANKEDSWPDLSPLITEISILAHPGLRSNRYFPRLIGIGWQSIPRDDMEELPYAPYLVTEFGKRGNLADYLQYYHRKETSVAHKLDYSNMSTNMRMPSNVSRTINLPWAMKLRICLFISEAVQLLHHLGVVHGDIKMENVITSASPSGKPGVEDLHWKLCDFGSSTLLVEGEAPNDNSKCYRLRSRTVPWDAPESSDSLSVIEMVKTDVYSFGMLFARIMLNGHDIFDPKFHVAIDTTPNRDYGRIKLVKQDDRVVEHVINRMKELNSYSPSQLHVIRKILCCTVRRNPEDRIRCMFKISMLIAEASNLKNDDLTSPGDMDKKLTPLKMDPCTHCFSWAKHDSHSLFVSRPKGLSGLGKIHGNSIQQIYPILKEVVHSLQLIASQDKPSHSSNPLLAESSAHLALCHLHGFGTAYNPLEALKWFKVSAATGDARSMMMLGTLSLAVAQDSTQFFPPTFLAEIRRVFPTNNNRIMGKILYSFDLDSYRKGIARTRSGPADLISGYRFLFTDAAAESSEADNEGNLLLRPVGDTVALPTQFGLTRLHRASMEGRIEVVEECLAIPGADVNHLTMGGFSPLWIACNCGHAEIVELLLSAGASPTQRDNQAHLTPFHFLSRFAEYEIPKIGRLLKKAGGNPNAMAKSRETPLMFVFNATRNFRVESAAATVETLLGLGASPLDTAGWKWKSSSLECPLRMASQTLLADLFLPIHDKMCEFLAKATHMPPSRLEGNFSSITEVCQTLIFVVKRLELDCWCFLWAVQSAVVTRTIENGRELKESLRISLLVLLSPAMRYVLRVKTGKSALVHSIVNHSFDIAFSILENRLFSTAELNSPDVLEAAFAAHSLDLVIKIIEAGVDCNTKNRQGHNFLHLAAIHGWTKSSLDKICRLVGDGVDFSELVNCVDDEQSTPFDTCVLLCRFALADWMYRLGVDIDSRHFMSTIAGMKYTLTLLGRSLTTKDETAQLRQVRYLIGHKPSFLVNLEMGDTALTACWTPWRMKRKRFIYPESRETFTNEAFMVLIDYFSNLEYITKGNYLGITPLHMAAACGNLAAVKTLLERGADINAMANGKETPLESVGDSLYNLAKETTLSDLYKQSQGKIGEATIEYFVIMEVYKYLESHGALPGSAIESEVPKPLGPEALRVEQVYSRLLDQNTMMTSPPNSSGSITTAIAPPPGRRDLGVTPYGFSITPTKEYFEGGMRKTRRLLWEVLKPEQYSTFAGQVTKEDIRRTSQNKDDVKRMIEILKQDLSADSLQDFETLFATGTEESNVIELLEKVFKCT